MGEEARHAAFPDPKLADAGAMRKPDPFNLIVILAVAALLLWVLT